MIALQVVRTSFGFHLRECMGSCFPPWVQSFAEGAHVYRRSIVRRRTFLDKKVEDDFKVNADRTKSQPIELPASNLKSQW